MASELEKVVAEMREAVGCGRTIGQGGQCERRDYACGECAKLQAWADRLAALDGAAKPKFTTGHCENAKQPGGCQLHNLHCGWPNCDRRPIPAPPEFSDEQSSIVKKGAKP